jgi:hypothetical protein
MTSCAPIHSYECSVDVPFRSADQVATRVALSKAHGHVWSEHGDVPTVVQDAHWLLNANQQQTVIVDVFANGSRRIRMSP